MKKYFCLISLILIIFLGQVSAQKENIKPITRSVGSLQISIDPRMELLTTIQLLANYPIIDRNLSYSKDIMKYFKSFSSQEAVIMTDSLFQKYGFSYDAPVSVIPK